MNGQQARRWAAVEAAFTAWWADRGTPAARAALDQALRAYLHAPADPEPDTPGGTPVPPDLTEGPTMTPVQVDAAKLAARSAEHHPDSLRDEAFLLASCLPDDLADRLLREAVRMAVTALVDEHGLEAVQAARGAVHELALDVYRDLVRARVINRRRLLMAGSGFLEVG